MKHRPLGRSSVSVSPVIHGCMDFADDDARAVRAVHAAFEAGITTFDTAPLYGFGRSETLLARAIADRRQRVQILTKVGLGWDSDHGRVLFQATDRDGVHRVVRRDSRPGSIERGVEDSLRRLGVDVLDLLQVHHRDPDTPLGDVMGALANLVRQGKVRAVGVSNFSLADCRQAAVGLDGVGLASVQLEYNMVRRQAETDILPWAAAEGVAVLSYSPLAQGVLAGRQLGGQPPPPDWRRGTPYFTAPNLRAIHAALEDSVVPLARELGVNPATVCLAWLLGRPGLTAAIAGASTPQQARANAAAADIELTGDQRARLEARWRRVKLSASPPPARRLLLKLRSLLSRLRG